MEIKQRSRAECSVVSIKSQDWSKPLEPKRNCSSKSLIFSPAAFQVTAHWIVPGQGKNPAHESSYLLHTFLLDKARTNSIILLSTNSKQRQQKFMNDSSRSYWQH